MKKWIYSVSGKNKNEVFKISQHFKLYHLHVWDVKHMYFPPSTTQKTGILVICQYKFIAIQHLPEICLLNLIKKRQRKDVKKKIFGNYIDLFLQNL